MLMVNLMEKTVTVKKYITQIDTALDKKNLQEVRDSLSNLSENDLERIDIKKRVAIYYSYNGESKRAINCFQELIELEPESADNYVNLMKLLQHVGQTRKAFKIAGIISQKFKKIKKVNLDVAKLLFVQKRYT